MLLLVLGLLISGALAQIPDVSPKCLTCQATVATAQTIFGNGTDVAAVLKALDDFCKSEFNNNTNTEQICEDLMAQIVAIPESLIEGMESLAWPVPLGFCATIFQCHVRCCKTPYTPEQIHIGLTNDLSETTVMWTTLNITANNFVQYGLSANGLSNQADGTFETYTAAGWLGTLHRATMSGLKPATQYFYRVGSAVEGHWSPVLTFTTFPAAVASFNVAVLGDMAYDNQSDATVANLAAAVQAGAVDLVIHVGDISYADGFEPHWDNFFNKIQPIASRVPYMVCPGNHEFWYNFSAFKHRFDMPGVSSRGGSGDNMFYSWSLGPVYFISMNSETAVDTADISHKQQLWLAAELAALDRTVFPWVIVYHHRPLYCSNSGQSCTRPDSFGVLLRAQVEALYLKYKVDLVITGHVHDYERTYPMSQGNDHFPANLPEWSAAHSSSIGFATMAVSKSQLLWQYFAAGATPVLQDKFAMTKTVTAPGESAGFRPVSQLASATRNHPAGAVPRSMANMRMKPKMA